MEVGFMKADSANLPKVDSFMVASFFACNPDLCSSEFRHVKTSISSRQSYGDDAIGYVQLKRDGDLCVLKCKICPEHKVRSQPYSITMVVEEKEEIVERVECHDCSAANGCCKHAVAFLMWCHRRSEEPSCTDIECYWKKPKLSKVGSSLKFIKISEMGSSNGSTSLPAQKNEAVFDEFLQESKKIKLENCQILKHHEDYEEGSVLKLSLHYLSAKFNKKNDLAAFLNKIHPLFTKKNLNIVENHTREQYKSSAWHELRYGRITASKAFEATRCKRSDGALVASIMGAKVPDTAAMKRGRKLENIIKSELSKHLGKISQCGLFICPQYPVIAASPDGILNGDTVIEIKCPTSEKNYKCYVSNNEKITAKFYAQVQLQMHVTGYKKCLYCVASWNFETSKKIFIEPIEYDVNFTESLILELQSFWNKNIYPLIFNSTN